MSRWVYDASIQYKCRVTKGQSEHPLAALTWLDAPSSMLIALLRLSSRQQYVCAASYSVALLTLFHMKSLVWPCFASSYNTISLNFFLKPS